MGRNTVWFIVAAVATYTAVAAAPASYHCDDSQVKLSPKCNQSCIQTIGSSLISLFKGLSDQTPAQTWHGVGPGNECDSCASSSNTTPQGALPAYCCWPGVFCCSEDASSAFDDPRDMVGCNDDFPMGVHQLAMRGWSLSGSLTKAAVDALVQLTLYGLHSIDLSANALVGTIPRSIGRLNRLRTLNLNLNRLEGTLPMEMADMEQLNHFYASFNNLSGTLKGRFCSKNNSSLATLILRANNLSGTIDMTHCTGLELLDIQDNRFYGSLPVGVNNQQLISLRATNNMFNSSIPDAVWQLPLLTTLDLANNDFQGTLSPYMGTVNNLVNIILSNNSFHGTIPAAATSNSQMLVLQLGDNPGLYGTLPAVMNMVGIRVLDLHNTSISGTIPPVLGAFPYLETVDIRYTRMLCCDNQSQADALAAKDDDLLLPSFLQFNQVLFQFDTTRNMQESEIDPDQPTDVMCGSVKRRYQPDSEWNVLGLPVTNDAVGNQQWLISPLYSFFKNCTCTPAYVHDADAQVPVSITSAWCEDEHRDNEQPPNGTCVDVYIFRCVAPTPQTLSLRQRVAIGVVGALCAAILLAAANMCLAHASKVRRYYMRARTRLQGTPKHGTMSLVVTDIEGYSEIFKRTPEVMYRALVIHNRVLNAAKYANCGFVLEQEGDSFTMAFYNAFDAVAFCLQAQQALNSAQWPEGLDGEEPAFKSADSTGPTRKPSLLQQRLSRLLAPSSRRRFPGRSAASATLSDGDGSTSITFHQTPSQQLTQALASRLAGISGGLGGFKASAAGENTLFCGLRVRMGVCTGDVPTGTPIKSSALFQTAKVVSDFGNGGQVIMDHVTFATVKDSLTVLGAVGANGINYQRLAAHRSLWTSLKVMLRCSSPLEPAEEAVVLDMGAYQHTAACAAAADPGHNDVNCYLPSGTQQERSSPAQAPDGCCRSWSAMLAQLYSGRSGMLSSSSSSMPSSAAAATAAASSEAVAVQGSAPPSRQNTGPVVRRGLSALLAGRMLSSTTDSSSLPSVLSMPHSRLACPGSETAQPSTCIAGAADAEGGLEVQHSQPSFLGRMRSLKRSMSHAHHKADTKRRNWSCVRLFQILPPSLAARGHTWHNLLNTKEGWQCWDMPYFDAPGSKAVPLSGGGAVQWLGSSSQGPGVCCFCNSFVSDASTREPSASAAAPQGTTAQGLRCRSGLSTELQDGPPAAAAAAAVLSGLPPLLQPLPAVTVVFMAVENPEALVRRRRTFTPQVQALLNRVVRDALKRCGGYLCRIMEGDLRFMLAFGSAVSALEWCLVVQEAAMYMAWPTEPLLLYEGCTVEHDEQQRIVFRGPRLKMGVCEGVPSSIFPDHEGRADYHGAVVNMAARFTDKAAKGGQIACTLELAQKAMGTWAGTCSSSTEISLQDSAAAAAATLAAMPNSIWHSPATSVDEEAAVFGAVEQQEQQSVVLQIRGHQQQLPPPQQLQQQGSNAAAPPRLPVLRSVSNTQRNAWAKRPTIACTSPPSPVPSATAGAGEAAAAAAAGFSPLTSPTTNSPNASSPFLECPVSAQVQYSSMPPPPLQQQQQHPPVRSWPGSPPSGRVSSSGAPSAGSRPYSFIHGSAAWQQQRQQQQQGITMKLPAVQLSRQRVSSASGAASALEGAASSAFRAANITTAPVQVEVHRLGVFAFKGGPVQQEMVQIVSSDLLGRLRITDRVTVQPSRKGQMLQKLEGQVGAPVTVQLPTLAQDYKAALPERLFPPPARFSANRARGHADVLYASTSSSSDCTLPQTNSAPADIQTAAAAARIGHGQQQQQRGTWATNSTTAAAAPPTAAVRHSDSGVTTAAACAPQLSSLRVMSDIPAQGGGSSWEFARGCMQHSSTDAGAGSNTAAKHAAAAASSPVVVGAQSAPAEQPDILSGSGSSAAAAATDAELGTCSKASSITVLDYVGIGFSTAELECEATAAAAAAVDSACGSCDVHSNVASGVTRHDSFCSVVPGDVEDLGRAAAAGDMVAACKSRKPGSMA